jgi:hypothetical protein
VDPIVLLLTRAVSEQNRALQNLAPGRVGLPQANTAFHTAAGSMQRALDALRGLQPPTADEQDDTIAGRRDGNFDEGVEGLESESQNNNTQPLTPGDFQEALSLRSLPMPNYTSAEILAEEIANQQKRARRRAARAGSKVEKNW